MINAPSVPNFFSPITMNIPHSLYMQPVSFCTCSYAQRVSVLPTDYNVNIA